MVFFFSFGNSQLQLATTTRNFNSQLQLSATSNSQLQLATPQLANYPVPILISQVTNSQVATQKHSQLQLATPQLANYPVPILISQVSNSQVATQKHSQMQLATLQLAFFADPNLFVVTDLSFSPYLFFACDKHVKQLYLIPENQACHYEMKIFVFFSPVLCTILQRVHNIRVIVLFLTGPKI